MKCLELFSGTGSVGKVMQENNIETISVDIEPRYKPTILTDIMKWNYKEYPRNHFDIITASPVCMFWSHLRYCWLGRPCLGIRPNGEIITREILQEDIDKYGKPMVDKMFEIIQYFQPKYYWIENPKTSSMWKYIKEKYENLELYYNRYDYCKYSLWGYQKPTIFATNFEVIPPMICKKDCENIIKIKTQKGDMHKGYKIPIKGKYRILHKNQLGNMKIQKSVKESVKHLKTCSNVGSGTTRDERYRIPPKLIEELLESIYLNMYIEG